nr:MAG TPA: hypothetical protein [Caudoviricetes sp.]
MVWSLSFLINFIIKTERGISFCDMPLFLLLKIFIKNC